MATSTKTEIVDKTAKYRPRLPEDVAELRAAFKENPRGSKFQELFLAAFADVEDPYQKILHLIKETPDSLPKYNNMRVALMYQFTQWMNEDNRREKFARFLTDDVKRRSFEFAVENTHMLKSVTDNFNLMDNTENYIDRIRQLARDGNFKEAADCITTLKLQKYFLLKEILIPCILQDKGPLDTYLNGHEDLQKELVSELDKLCAPAADVEAYLRSYDITGIRKEKFSTKPLQKLVAKLSKQYNIPPELTPMLTYARSLGSLKYLFVRRYHDKSLSDDNWEDMILEAINGDDRRLLPDLFKLLRSYGDIPEAVRFAVRFNARPDELPNDIWQRVRELSFYELEDLKQPKQESWRTPAQKSPFLKLPFPVDTVIMIDNPTNLAVALNEVKRSEIIGLDMEWQPTFGRAFEKVSVLQVATMSRVVLLDIGRLLECLTKEQMKETVTILFCTEIPQKLGFGLVGDMRILAITLPDCREELEQAKNCVCLSELVKQLVHRNHDFLFYQKPASVSGRNGIEAISDSADDKILKLGQNLAQLCHRFLGEPLDKSEQFSNWARRPLRSSQLEYAALDAYCLLMLHNELKKRAEELGIEFNDAVSKSVIRGKLKQPSEKKSHSTKQCERAELLQLIERLNEETSKLESKEFRLANDVKVITDSMLIGLGNELRRCGIDTAIAKNLHSRDEIFQIAKNDLRILLTRGSMVSVAAARLPTDLICIVPDLSDSKEQLKWFLTKFKVKVSETDVFSRCMVCNCNEFVFIGSPLLQVVYDNVVASADPHFPVPFDRKTAYDSVWNYLQKASSSSELLCSYDSCQPPFKLEDEIWSCSLNGGRIELLTGKIIREHVNGADKETLIQVESIEATGVFKSVEMFYVCKQCGKIYWDGKHMGRYVSRLRDLVDLYSEID